jgi:large subunit ribosomal protein L29
MTRAAELRELDGAEMRDRLADARKELFNLRFQLATGRLDNISRIGAVRKEIARIITLETERGADGQGAGTARGGTAQRPFRAGRGSGEAGRTAGSATGAGREVSAATGGALTEED